MDTERLLPGGGSINEAYGTMPGPTVDGIRNHLPTTPCSDGECSITTHVYRRRWYILFVFSTASFTQSMLWNTWGPIAASAEVAFSWSKTDIAVLALWGPAAFALSVYGFSWIMQTKGLRWAVLIETFLICSGAAIRCIPVAPGLAWWTMNTGQILDIFAGPVAMAAIPLVSATWFPPDQRTVATALASRTQSIGGGIPFLLGPYMVRDPSYYNISFAGNSTNSSRIAVENIRKDIYTLMYIHCGWAALVFLLVLLYFPARPPLPPSVSAGQKRLGFKSGVFQILRSGNFWLLGFPYSLCYGVYIGWTAVLDINLNTNLKEYKITQVEAGWIGFYGTVAGFIAGVGIARIADVFARRMKLFLLVLYSVASLGFLVFALLCAQIIPVWKPALYMSRIVSAAAMSAIVPLMFETICEAVYPITEAVANGSLTLIKNLWVFAFLAVFFIPDIGTTWINWSLLACGLACVPLLAIYRGSYGRLDVDTAVTRDDQTDKHMQNNVQSSGQS